MLPARRETRCDVSFYFSHFIEISVTYRETDCSTVLFLNLIFRWLHLWIVLNNGILISEYYADLRNELFLDESWTLNQCTCQSIGILVTLE